MRARGATVQGADELRLTVLGELRGSRGDVVLDLGGRRGARGFMQIRLTENGTAHTFATTY